MMHVISRAPDICQNELKFVIASKFKTFIVENCESLKEKYIGDPIFLLCILETIGHEIF